MSAWITEKAHIDAIITTARQGPSDPRVPGHPGQYWPEGQSADQVGQMLTDAMVASVRYRYDDEQPLPGPCQEWYGEPYRFQETRLLTVAEAFQAVQCYHYQSCERPDFDQSETSRFCERLLSWLSGQAKRSYINRYGEVLPVGYEDADAWGLTESQVRAS